MMALVLGPNGDLLLAPSGNLAYSLNCCCNLCDCCEQIMCGLDTVYLPECGPFPTRYIGFTADVDITPCQNTCIQCGSPHKAIGLGSNANITRTDKKLACASTDENDVIIPSPEDLCAHASRCRVWQSCALPNDTITGLQIARYTDIGVFNCTGNFTLYTTATMLINLAYDHENLRFILAIWLGPIGAGGQATGLLFLGTHAFDARNLSAYSAFPLTFTNALGGCNCLCADPVYTNVPTRAYATGGTVTLHLHETCQDECPTSLNGGGDEPEASQAAPLAVPPNASEMTRFPGQQTSSVTAGVPRPYPTPTAQQARHIIDATGPPIAAHRVDDATALDLAATHEERRCRCRRHVP